MQFLVARKWPSYKGGKGHVCKAGGAKGGNVSPFLSEQNGPAGLAIPGAVRISSKAAVGTRFAIEFTAIHGELHQPFRSAHEKFLLLKGTGQKYGHATYCNTQEAAASPPPKLWGKNVGGGKEKAIEKMLFLS